MNALSRLNLLDLVRSSQGKDKAGQGYFMVGSVGFKNVPEKKKEGEGEGEGEEYVQTLG